jgi:hypothetical protein
MKSFDLQIETYMTNTLLEEAAPSVAVEKDPYRDIRKRPEQASNRVATVICTLWTVVALAVHGYHPYAEDGGIYLADIKKVLSPYLYSRMPQFPAELSRFSLFARCVAALVHLTTLNLMMVMLLIHLASIWLTLYAAWQLAARCSRSCSARFGAVSLLALCLTIPVAGTSLILMDPYVTARSISTPCSLFALVFLLDAIRCFRQRDAAVWRSLLLCLLSLSIAAMVHPLMAAYALGCITLLASCTISNPRWRAAATLAVCLGALVVAACLYVISPEHSAEYTQVALTRDYWFLDEWHWYELAGLIAPLAVVCLIFLFKAGDWSKPKPALAQMTVAAGLSALVTAMLFARMSSASYVVARLQPLRVFQLIYIVMILAIGIFLGERVLKQHRLRWAALLLAIGFLMLRVQLDTFSHSAHIEFPWSAPVNAWEQGFTWIKDYTPQDAVFGLDSNYIFAAGEDAQYFSAIAERSALPDHAKDGGIAAIVPRLTAEWQKGETAQRHLDVESDAARMSVLEPTPVRWIVLSNSARTAFPCVYENDAMKVCRVVNPSSAQQTAR